MGTITHLPLQSKHAKGFPYSVSNILTGVLTQKFLKVNQTLFYNRASIPPMG
jgi:hypothetical protein